MHKMKAPFAKLLLALLLLLLCKSRTRLSADGCPAAFVACYGNHAVYNTRMHQITNMHAQLSVCAAALCKCACYSAICKAQTHGGMVMTLALHISFHPAHPTVM
jgi:hypothetical protein